MRVALGASPHSGWAVLVGVGIDAGQPVLRLRRRVELIDPALPRQPYHAALDGPVESAEALVEEVVASAAGCAERELAAAGGELEAGGDEAVALAVVGHPPGELGDLDHILASHPRLHTAEGELYRRALTGAARKGGLTVTHADPKPLAEGIKTSAVLPALGQAAGPPWQRDHKLATLAALAALGR